MTKKILFLVFGIIALAKLSATHLVGGVIYYEKVGSNKYKIIFEIYKDCGSGVRVGFDGQSGGGQNNAEFYYSVYKETQSYINEFGNTLMLLDTQVIQSIIVNPCLEPNSSCVVRGRYETIITLDDPTKWYMVQYMRCCRNNGIDNIQNQPGSNDKPGMTIRTWIPPYGTTPNNSARFKNFPPIFICKGQQFYFDHSATDKDGDSLSYKLITPLEGLDYQNPTSQSQPFSVNPINWQLPYSLNDIMKGTPPMAIDSVTGLLSCNPTTLGRYVVSVMVSEYRNGVRIDSFFRDFQYNVVECNIPNSNTFFVPGTYDPINDIGIYVNCGEFKVDFTNSSTNADRYEWRFGDPKSGATNNVSTLATPSHTFSDTGEYIVTMFSFKKKPNGQLCVDSTRRICRIFPKIKVLFDHIPVCEGKVMSFTDKSVSVTGDITKWEWTFGNGGSSKVKNPTNIYLTDGTYNVKLKTTNSKGCDADTTLPVTVYPKPDFNVNSYKACLGQPLKLESNATVPSPNTIANCRWTLPGNVKVNSCSTSYTPPTPANGVINLWALTNQGCIDSINLPFTVFAPPTIVASNDQKICYDKTATITASGAVNYEWTPTTYLSSPNSNSTIVNLPYPDSMKYVVKGTDQNGCYNFDSVKVSFYLKPFISAGMDTSICLNPSTFFRDTVRLNGQGIFNTVYWLPTTGLDNPNIKNPRSKPLVNTDYIFHGIDNNNCLIRDTVRVVVLDPNLNLINDTGKRICFGDQIQLDPIDQGIISTYLWSPNLWIDNISIQKPTVTPLVSINYILQVSNYCYLKRDTYNVTVMPLPNLMLNPIDSICEGRTYQFSSNPGLIKYRWKTSELTFSDTTISNPSAKPKYTQWYVLIGTDQWGCVNKDSIKLRVDYPPKIILQGLKPYICYGDSIKLTALTNIPCTFIWTPNNYLSNNKLQTIFAFPPDTSEYSVQATSIQQCSSSYKLRVNVQGPIRPYAIRPVRLCKGSQINLYAEGGLYYDWGPNYNINDTLSPTPQVFPENTFTYEVKISNDCFIDSIKVDIYIDSIPSVVILKDTTIYRTQEITLTAVTSASSVEWFPKDFINSSPFSRSIQVSPFDTTMYRVVATDGRNCVGKDTVYVYVYGKNVLLIPTGFSPNRDGINDEFKVVKHLNIKKLNLFEVYNRWGQKVFSTTNINNGWDGTYENLPSPSGTYVWKVEAVSNENEKLIQSGNVSLIR